jgi:hypothetical protein
MRRVAEALREWLQLRRRLHDERRFHIENAAAEYRWLGMSPRAAIRRARSRFGGRRHAKTALRELGGDFAGLAHLFRAYRVPASAWLQPLLLLAAVGLILALSPAPRAIIEGVIGSPLAAQDRQTVVVAVAGWDPSERIIAAADFETMRTLHNLRAVERYKAIYVRGQAARGATLASIQSEIRARTGNRRLWAGWLFSETQVVTGPAQIVWLLLWFYVIVSLIQCAPSRGKGQWLLYGLLMALLHTLVSLVAWALAMQMWSWPVGGVGGMVFSLVFLAYMLLSAMQCRWWRSDLNQRCPVCLDRLVLPVTEGTAERVLLESAITESVCAHGHGVLVESRWLRRFRQEESPLERLAGA